MKQETDQRQSTHKDVVEVPAGPSRVTAYAALWGVHLHRQDSREAR